MQLRTVDATRDPKVLAQVKDLYFSAFPAEERIPWPLVVLNSRRAGVDLTAFLDGDTFCGFTYSVTVGDHHCLLFFAVAKNSSRYNTRSLRVGAVLAFITVSQRLTFPYYPAVRSLFGDGVVSADAPWVATENSPHRQAESHEKATFRKRLNGVG